MNVLEALKSIIKPHKKDSLTPLSTIWGEQLAPERVLMDYPRPQLQRTQYLSLNGYWEYAFTKTAEQPVSYEGKILVPFSPESTLSGVNRQLQPGEYLWYRRSLSADILSQAAQKRQQGMRLLLHFDAVDYHAQLFFNGQPILTHCGGYLPFEADLTELLTDTHNELVLQVQDPSDTYCQSRGKQTLERGGIFYTAQSGIWQSVWLEWVPLHYIQKLWFETDYDAHSVAAHIFLCSYCQKTEAIPLSLTIFAGEKQIAEETWHIYTIPQEQGCFLTEACLHISLSPEDFHSWSPEEPYLYDAVLRFGDDTVRSYFAMRLFSLEIPSADKPENDIPVFCLNHKPYFLMGVLDQGYWSDGLYTAPSDEALIYDISVAKSLGFNLLRKHIKVECARWYYHCDRLGMIVCQDMVNGGSSYCMPLVNYLPTLFPVLSQRIADSHYKSLARENAGMKSTWEQECLETVEYLKFFPSIAIWCPFNEGWGQFDAARITNLIKEADPSRLVDSASGWFDQDCGDFISLHNYFRPLTMKQFHRTAAGIRRRKKSDSQYGHAQNRAFFLSEYGGYACHIQGHSSVGRIYGYKRYATLPELQSAFRLLQEKSLLPLQTQGLSGAVYTQLSDVEEEVNGILTYDRKINKFAPISYEHKCTPESKTHRQKSMPTDLQNTHR